MAGSIGKLIKKLYGQLWNGWNDSSVEDTLSPGFTFRGSLGQETSGAAGVAALPDLVRSGSADSANSIQLVSSKLISASS